MNVYALIERQKELGRKSIALLADPDKYSPQTIDFLVERNVLPDFFFVGGSLVRSDTAAVVSDIRQKSRRPVILFPGDATQLTPAADAVLLLSLVSGRNPEYLIGQHVRAAHSIVRMNLEPIPTGYILIDGGRATAVEYVSGTRAIPADKVELVVATALAAQLLGHKMIYLEAGSGAPMHVSAEIVAAVRNATTLPLIVGGGLRSPQAVTQILDAGADIVVVGTAMEKDSNLSLQMVAQVMNYNKSNGRI